MKSHRILLCALLLGFLLGIYDGKVALWKDNGIQPWRVFPCPVSVLPQAEQNALKQGIRVDTMEDLNRLLENYLS